MANIIARARTIIANLWKWAAGVVAVFAIVAVIAVVLHEHKTILMMKWGSYDLLHDLMVAIAASLALGAAIWRVFALDSQAKTAEKRLLNEQFANAAELMAKETTGEKPKPAIAARINGIYIMSDLATKQPKEFAEQVVKNLIAYIKDNIRLTAQPLPEKSETPAKPRKIGGDVQAAFFALHDILGNKKIQKGIPDKILDFSYQDFSGLDLSGVDLQHYRKWTEADFRRCKLTDAHFQNADMQRVNFFSANLRGATLEGVVMNSAIMTEATLTEAIMPKINLSYIDLRGADLSRANLQSANLSHAKMHGTKMLGTYLNRIDNDIPTDLSEAHLYGADLMNANLQGANIKHAWLWGVDLTNAVLHDANLAGAYFRGACMYNTKISKSELTKDVKLAMNGNVMYEGKEEFASEIEECDYYDWRLRYYPDAYALNGVLDNFVYKGSDMQGGLELRIEAKKMMDSKISPDKWYAWLEDVDIDTGEHPQDYPEDDPEDDDEWL